MFTNSCLILIRLIWQRLNKKYQEKMEIEEALNVDFSFKQIVVFDTHSLSEIYSIHSLVCMGSPRVTVLHAYIRPCIEQLLQQLDTASPPSSSACCSNRRIQRGMNGPFSKLSLQQAMGCCYSWLNTHLGRSKYRWLNC